MISRSLLEKFKNGIEFIKTQITDAEILKLYIKDESQIVATKDDVDLNNLIEADLIPLNYNEFPTKDKKMSSMVLAKTPYLSYCLEIGKTFRAPLDDMAQIVGPNFSICNINDSSVFVDPKIKNALTDTNACLVINKGKGFTLTLGRDIIEAATCLMILEKSAKAVILAEKIDEPKFVNGVCCTKMRELYQKKYSKKLITGFKHNKKTRYDEIEQHLREEIIFYGNELVRNKLVERSWGNLSIRLDDEYMLVTPSGIEYKDLLPEDIVKVNIKTLEYEGKLAPTSEKNLHSTIYKNRKEVNAIIHTHSDCLSAYAVARKELYFNLKQDIEKYGPFIPCSTYGMSTTSALAKNTLKALGNKMACIISNHGMVSVGDTIDVAFGTAKELEDIAKKNLMK